MLVHLDTSLLVDAFCAPRRSTAAFALAISRSEVITFSTIVSYEWLRGPRTEEELRLVELQFDSRLAPVFGPAEARTAARLYRAAPKPRRREADIAIAACAIEHNAALWTLNPEHFADIPGLALYKPA